MSESTDTPNPEQVQIREILLKAAVLIEQKALYRKTENDLVSHLALISTDKDKYSTAQLKFVNHLCSSTTHKYTTTLKNNIIQYFNNNPKEVIGEVLIPKSVLCFTKGSPRVSRKKAREYLEKDFIPVEISAKALQAALGLTATWVTGLTFLSRLRESYPAYFALNEEGHLVYMGPLVVKS